MQGLGTGPISLFGTEEQKERWLPSVARGTTISAFALSEREAGSDVSALAMRAQPDGNQWRLDGAKTWISNAGIAGLYVVFARTGEAPGAKGLSAFVVEADTPGFSVAKVIDLIAPHPIGALSFDGVKVPAANMLGLPGDGFRIAMATLDVFRSTGAPPPSALHAGRWRGAKTREHAQIVRSALFRSATDPRQARRHGARGRRGCLLIDCPPGPRISRGPASAAKPAWRNSSPPRSRQMVICRCRSDSRGLGLSRGHFCRRAPLSRRQGVCRIYEGPTKCSIS